MKYLSIALIPVALLSIFFTCSAVADEAIDEIIVTADFRERPADKLPVSVSVVSGISSAKQSSSTSRNS